MRIILVRLFLVRIAPDEDDLGEDNLFVKFGLFLVKYAGLPQRIVEDRQREPQPGQG